MWVFIICEKSTQEIWKTIITIAKTEPDALKTSPKRVVYKAAEAIREFIGNKIADKIVKPKHLPAENSRNIEEIIMSPEKREKELNLTLPYHTFSVSSSPLMRVGRVL